MLNINNVNLNKLEVKIHDQMLIELSNNQGAMIGQLAEICQVSPSKISKFVRKLGFTSFKEYKNYFTKGEELPPLEKENLKESQRIYDFIKNFDRNIIVSFLNYFNKYGKIILYGIGPSFICAEYFAYRLQIFSNKFIIASSEKHLIENTADKDTLIVVISTTGIFTSFKPLYESSKKNKNEIIFLIEEFRFVEELKDQIIFYLTKTTQSDKFQPYEKSRTLFFIFFEEVVQELYKQNIENKK